VRGLRDRGVGDALIYLSPADGESADRRLTEELLAVGRRAGLEPQMRAYLAASRFVAFDARVYDPKAVFRSSVAALFGVRTPAAIEALMSGRRLALLTDAAGRVDLSDPAIGIEVYLLEAGLRAVPAFRALQDELNAVHAAATNA
jgi:hypothetical protein